MSDTNDKKPDPNVTDWQNPAGTPQQGQAFGHVAEDPLAALERIVSDGQGAEQVDKVLGQLGHEDDLRALEEELLRELRGEQTASAPASQAPIPAQVPPQPAMPQSAQPVMPREEEVSALAFDASAEDLPPLKFGSLPDFEEQADLQTPPASQPIADREPLAGPNLGPNLNFGLQKDMGSGAVPVSADPIELSPVPDMSQPAPVPQTQSTSSGSLVSDAWSHLTSQSSVSEPAPLQRDEPRTGSYGQLSETVSEPVGSAFSDAPVIDNQDPTADASASAIGALWSQQTGTDQQSQVDAPDALARALSDFQQLDHTANPGSVSGSERTERFYESSERSAFHGLETATPQAPVAPAPAVSLQSDPQVSSHSTLSSLSEPVPASSVPSATVDSYIPASSAQEGQNVDDPYAAFNQVNTGSSPSAPMVDPMAGYHPATSQPNIGGPSASAQVGHAPSVTVSGQNEAPAYDSPASYQDGAYQGHETQSGYAQDSLYAGVPGVPLSNAPHMSSGPHGTYSDPAVSQAAVESMPYLAEEGAVPYQQAMHEDTSLSEPAVGKSRKGLLAAGVVLGLAVLGGVAVWGLAGSGADNGESPVLVANTDPVKEAPDDPGGKVIPHQNKEVYDRIDGTNSDEGPNNLMPATEKPLALSEDGKSPRVISLSGGGASVPQQSADDGASADRSIVAPKKVRTVIVRPDGTIVKSSEDSANASNGIGSVDQQMLAATPSEQAMGQSLDTVPGGASNQAAVLGGNAAQAVGDAVTTSILPKRKPGGLINQQTSVASVQQPAVNSVAVAPAAPAVTQTPAARPAGNQPLSLLPPSNEQTNRTVRAPVVNRSSGSGGFTVQVSSQRTPEQARSSYSSIQSRVASVLGGYQPDIKRADLGSKGVFYRVRVGSFADRSGAIALCESIKAAGADCLVARQ